MAYPGADLGPSSSPSIFRICNYSIRCENYICYFVWVYKYFVFLANARSWLSAIGISASLHLPPLSSTFLHLLLPFQLRPLLLLPLLPPPFSWHSFAIL